MALTLYLSLCVCVCVYQHLQENLLLFDITIYMNLNENGNKIENGGDTIRLIKYNSKNVVPVG